MTNEAQVENNTEEVAPKFERFMLDEGIPVYLTQDKEFDPSKHIAEKMAYVCSSKGFLVYKENKLYKAVSKIASINFLPEIKEKAEFECSCLSLKMFQAIRSFFMNVYEKHKSEVAILLYHNFEEEKWLWTVPKQTVSAATVQYDETDGMVIVSDEGEFLEEMPKGYKKLGSIHSHAAMSAFHSGVDDKDEYSFDGLHITIGSFNSADCTYSTRWIIAGQEIKSDIKEVVEELTSSDYPVELAMGQVEKKSYTTTYTTTKSSAAVTKSATPATNAVDKGKVQSFPTKSTSPVVAHGKPVIQQTGHSAATSKKKDPQDLGVKLL